MSRYALFISYDGTGYHGWQTQRSGRGVQDAVRRALSKLGEDVVPYGAGRTDTGVHARRQVAHCDLKREWEPSKLALALNAHLPDDVRVMGASLAADGFDARRSAVSREYRYHIWNSHFCYPFIKRYVMHLPMQGIDWRAAGEAVRAVEGTHDFRAFCRTVDAPDDTTRTVSDCRLYRRGDLLVLRVRANGFLTNMIRIIVGNMIAVGTGRRDAAWLAGLLSGAERKESSQTAPASGLFFWDAEYPDGSFISSDL